MSDTAGKRAFLYFWQRYLYDTISGPILRLNQNSRAMSEARAGDELWAFAPVGDRRYAVVARLVVARAGENPEGSEVRETAGRWFVEADPGGMTYFDPDAQPDASVLIRSLALQADAAVLGQAFQGGAGVRRLAMDAAHVLATAALNFSPDSRMASVSVRPRVSIHELRRGNVVRYWWVNHKQTHRQEIEGGYIWAPKRNADGGRNQTYDNLRRVVPGDVVFSYAAGQVRHVGIVTRPATSQSKPDEFRGAGLNWDRNGWMIPIAWRETASPLRPKEFIAELRPHLPPRHSPLHVETGNGLQNVYLAAVPDRMAEVLLAHLDLGAAEVKRLAEEAGNDDGAVRTADDAFEKSLVSEPGLDATEREAVAAARRGQGRFRLAVEAVERGGCRLTSVADRRLLRASHIKPWRSCDTNLERLDGENGLLLTPTPDHLFDRGYISFTDDGTMLVSPLLNSADLARLGFPSDPLPNVGPFSLRQRRYLAFHRENVFLHGR